MCPNTNDGPGAAPTVSDVSPPGGPGSGGTSLTVAGSGFTGATAVTFGATPAASFAVQSDTQLTAVSPAGGVGTVDVTVTAPTGTSGANPGDQFTYLAVTRLNPATGAAAGGYTIQVIGSGFAGATAVKFNTILGTDLLVAPDGNSLTVKVPAGSATVHVTVTTPLGTSPQVPADQFTYKTGKESKEHKDKDKDFKEKDKDFKDHKESKEHKESKDKDFKDGKELKELKEKEKDAKEKEAKEKEAKEKEAKEKDGKEHKDLKEKEKEDKEGKEHKDKEDKENKDKEGREKPPEALFENHRSVGVHPSGPVDPTATAPDAGPMGRAFIAPADRPAVGRKALTAETDDL